MSNLSADLNKELLSAGTNVKTTETNGKTSLFAAAKNGLPWMFTVEIDTQDR